MSVGFDYWPEIRRREVRRRAPESALSILSGALLGAGFVYLIAVAMFVVFA